ncbi:MAG: hypothetical protein IPJ26_11235 [Bacteroidetes bacterium]|nr:hypothetical protein [Bacteroidota bacterium]
MIETIEVKHLERSTNPHSENTSNETLTNKDPEGIHPNQETENMEVHHHAHHNGKKNWKSYFWEFLMLFLAVFCGFLAEYQLEHKIERDREEVYLKNLFEDLEDDVNHFNEYDSISFKYFSNIDSLMMLMKSPDRDKHLNRIYFLERAATMNVKNFLSYNSRTFEQMKHSGLLRLIRNQQVADSISAYYFSLQAIDLQNNIIKDRITEYMYGAGKVFDAQVLFQIFKTKQEPNIDSLKLITNNEQEINMFLTNAQYYYGARKLQQEACKERAKRAQRILELMRKEYHFE